MEIFESDEEEDISVSETVLKYPFKTEFKTFLFQKPSLDIHLKRNLRNFCFRNRPKISI